LRRKNALLIEGTAAALSMMGSESLFVLTFSIFRVKNIRLSEGRENTACVGEEGRGKTVPEPSET